MSESKEGGFSRVPSAHRDRGSYSYTCDTHLSRGLPHTSVVFHTVARGEEHVESASRAG